MKTNRNVEQVNRNQDARMLTLLIAMSVLLFHIPSFSFAAGESIGSAQNGIGGFTVVRTDGIEESLEGKGSLPLFEGDVVKTDVASQGLLEFSNGIQVALNENTEFTILSRWVKKKGFTRILRLKQGEIWVDTQGGPKPLEIETPVATAAVKGTEFDLLVEPNGQSTLTVVSGIVEFGTAFGTCPIKTSKISYGNRGKKCTKPKSVNVDPSIAWTKGIRQ